MCRSIKTLFNFEPPATEEEIKASSLQFVRKLSGFTHPGGLRSSGRGGRGSGARVDRVAGDLGRSARSGNRSSAGQGKICDAHHVGLY